MGNVKHFMVNFGLSLAVYIASILLMYSLLTVMHHLGFRSTGVFSFPVGVEIVFGLCVLIFIASYFFLGTRLKQLDSHWLNYLSVCGISVFVLLSALLMPYTAVITGLPFFTLGSLIHIWVDNYYISIPIISILPSLIIWLGMMFKSR